MTYTLPLHNELGMTLQALHSYKPIWSCKCSHLYVGWGLSNLIANSSGGNQSMSRGMPEEYGSVVDILLQLIVCGTCLHNHAITKLASTSCNYHHE